ncbi:Phosphonate-binding periplasmic protein [Synechococcus sp. CC9902]|jgi:phosphonate transport system substrate-binding protein|uniref:putative selenate ABC transporter substrate-binding protein n=1 Tax=Synechococcus sp. (strain CC9902) TaxID=316279 RepID=UPI00005D4127|nr:putative selenate ABC transporter substrate-binding protein [Synechococcus sp. CC9902]ABB26147.1 Phosphonate-binding periplasmic protein [Synechococcus sp. CC9902]
MPTQKLQLSLAARLLTGIVVATAVASCGSGPLGTESPVLHIGAIPDQNPEKLNRLYSSLSAELSDQLKVPVEYVPVSNYPAAVTAFRTGSLDLVWFGGLTGVQARLQTPGAKVLAQRDIDAKFTSVFIANGASGLRPFSTGDQLTNLKGRRLSFGSESSTSGRLMPQYFMSQNGVGTDELAGGAPGFSGSHDATIAVVQSGAYEVGALNEQVWKSNVEDGRADPNKVSVIWRTPPYVDYHWVARPDLDERFGNGFTNKVQTALLAITADTPRGETILELFGAAEFIPAQNSDYDKIEAVGRQLGKIR